MSDLSRASLTRAAAGILRRADGATFMQQRRAPQSFAGFWEFPGGKINPGENVRAALRRELREEIGVRVRRASHFVQRRHRHPGGREVLLDFFCIDEYDGAPRGREGQNCIWAAINEMPSPLLPANELVCKWLRLPPLYAITAADIFGEKEMLRRLRRALRARRFDFVQIRDKRLPARRRADFARQAADLCRARNALFCVGDDENLAAQSGGGLHLSSRRLAECRARPPLEWVGASCHSADDVARAADLHLDFAALSPICKTASHPESRPMGWRRFGQIAAQSGVPIYALGGLRPTDLQTARRHNACGIAMLRGAWE